MPSLDPSGSSPCRRMPCLAQKASWASLRRLATSSRPGGFRSASKDCSRKVRWSRNARIRSGSRSGVPSGSAWARKLAAIGVTYSWENRQWAFTKMPSPGLTEGRPVRPEAASTTAFRARIFSTRVMGRGPWVGTGTWTSPAMRARLNGKSPPRRTISAVIPSRSRVNSSTGMASPALIRSTKPTSVDVNSPRFWQFWW